MEVCKGIPCRLLWQDFLIGLSTEQKKVSIPRLFVLRVDGFCLPFSFNHLQGGRYHCVHSAVKRVHRRFGMPQKEQIKETRSLKFQAAVQYGTTLMLPPSLARLSL
jgi:hypothetical protein